MSELRGDWPNYARWANQNANSTRNWRASKGVPLFGASATNYIVPQAQAGVFTAYKVISAGYKILLLF